MTNDEEQNKQEITKPKSVEREERILQFWNEDKTFKKSVEKDAPNGEFVFYDGPPFATGKPHYGHLVPGTMKDVIPRFKTMQGYRVTRRWGWDTQGVPIEALVQKEENLTTKQDIEEFGVKNFTDAARKTVFRFADHWQDIIPKTGRWIDFDNLYITMAPNYTESIWWMWKTLHEKNLAYEGFKSMHVSPPLETALSNFEVNQGYKDITDLTATAKFKLESEENTFVLAWTTTPWTLPGNVALAVGESLSYVYVSYEGETFIVAEDLVESVFKNKEGYVVEKTIAGLDLVGKSYEPIFDYYAKDASLENKENGWKIYAADFVTTESGTGIVHIAPAFGEDDLVLGQENNLPFVQHVQINGTIKDEVEAFAGMQAKPTDNPMQTDIEMVKWLAHNDALFSKEKYTHSYPHCYRTGAPLLNYAMSSWFINVTDIKDKLVKENDKVNWVPDFVGSARFGNWLKDAKDWAVSRARYWGTPIPIWRSEDGKELAVLGSLADVKEKTKGEGKIFMMRHGEAEHNVSNTISGSNDTPSHLTEKGKEEAKEAAAQLKDKKIDVVIASPLFRTQETAEIITEELGLDASMVISDERIVETQTGLEGKPISEYRSCFENNLEKFTKACDGGETLTEMKNRVGDFLYEIHETHKDKNVLIVGHEYVAWMLDAVAAGDTPEQASAKKELQDDFVATGEVRELDFAPIPHNENFELDFHRPYIDDVMFEQNGKEMKRILDVFDTWIDSGSVPFASNHYPFEKDVFDPEKNMKFPADFISEGLDQTRGWFYSMIVLNTALFGVAPYKNVMVNGLLLAEDGRKMSKSLNNYPPMEHILENYGADALRYFLMASPLVRAESSPFSEKGVDEVMKKLLGRLDNVVTFYEMYADESIVPSDESEHVLDVWILAELRKLHAEVTTSLDSYEIDKAARPLMTFLDDLSTWYIRRSRDRFKSDDEVDKKRALETTNYVLVEYAKLLAPFTPFMADDVYMRITGNQDSVHLADWSEVKDSNENSCAEMNTLRDVVTRALEARTKTGMKVRQPLASLTLKNITFKDKVDLLEILKDELNVKEVLFDESQEEGVVLDIIITPELQAEGDAREVIRAIQQTRKQAKLSPEDEITLTVSENGKELVEQFKDEITKVANVTEFVFGDVEDGVEVKLSEMSVQFLIA